jgi:hypothetical protein
LQQTPGMKRKSFADAASRPGSPVLSISVVRQAVQLPLQAHDRGLQLHRKHLSMAVVEVAKPPKAVVQHSLFGTPKQPIVSWRPTVQTAAALFVHD